METKKWILVNIGCIECSVSSNIVGVFDNEIKAKEVMDMCDKEFSWREGGQNAFEIFEFPELNVINNEYLNPTE